MNCLKFGTYLVSWQDCLAASSLCRLAKNSAVRALRDEDLLCLNGRTWSCCPIWARKESLVIIKRCLMHYIINRWNTHRLLYYASFLKTYIYTAGRWLWWRQWWIKIDHPQINKINKPISLGGAGDNIHAIVYSTTHVKANKQQNSDISFVTHFSEVIPTPLTNCLHAKIIFFPQVCAKCLHAEPMITTLLCLI